MLPSKARKAKPTPIAISVKAIGKAEHDEADEEHEHQHAELRIGHGFASRGGALFEDDFFEFFDVVQPLRPAAGA